MPGPVPRRSRGVHVLVSSLTTSAFSVGRTRIGDRKIVRSATSERLGFSQALSFLTFWPPSLLAAPIAPTAAVDGALVRSHVCGTIYSRGPGACSGGAPLPRLLSTTGQPWRLLPSRTYVVTFIRIGYASRPIPSNWRQRGSHLTRLAALSAAPGPEPRTNDAPHRLRLSSPTVRARPPNTPNTNFRHPDLVENIGIPWHVSGWYSLERVIHILWVIR